MTWAATVLTLFPEMFPGPLGISLLGKALAAGAVVARCARHPRSWHRPASHGGRHARGRRTRHGDARRRGDRRDRLRCERAGRPLIYLSPRGTPLTQARVAELSAGPGAILLCGRFEGLDQRAIEARQIEEISLGDFVLAGGEIAAMALIEAVVRLIPGVLGDAASTAEESFSSGLLEYPQYTRPQIFAELPIPDVLNQGNHKEIAKWRQAEAERLTQSRRPDLWTLYEKRKRIGYTRASQSPTKCPETNEMNLLQTLEAEQMKAVRAKAHPEFRAGDTLKVNVKVVEVSYDEKAKQKRRRERLQAFEGVCIARQGAGLNESFTVRKISYGEGVERVFPVYSPLVDSVQVVRKGRVRRAKLYYLRGRTGKSARIAERQETEAVEA